MYQTQGLTHHPRAADALLRGQEAIDRGEQQGAEGRLALAEARHAERLVRRDRRRIELEHERALTLKDVGPITRVLVLPHPEREAPEVQRLQLNPKTQAAAVRVVMERALLGPAGLRRA